MIGLYRKRPVTIEAVQWTGDNLQEIIEFAGPAVRWEETGGLFIHTLEGPMWAKRGSYIIKGIKGEFYPCEEGIFGGSYDKVVHL